MASGLELTECYIPWNHKVMATTIVIRFEFRPLETIICSGKINEMVYRIKLVA